MIDNEMLPVPGAKKPNNQTSPLTILNLCLDDIKTDPALLITPTDQPEAPIEEDSVDWDDITCDDWDEVPADYDEDWNGWSDGEKDSFCQNYTEHTLQEWDDDDDYDSEKPVVYGIWDSDEEDVYLSDLQEIKQQGTGSNLLEVQVLTQTGRLNATQPTENTPLVPAPPQEEDPIIMQLKKTKADINLWKLLMGSKEHRDALLKALAQVHVANDTTPEELVSIIFQAPSQAISFLDEDLPEEPRHNKPLLINVQCKNHHVPMTLVDNGSAINVCPLRTALRLGLSKGDFRENSQSVRAYDNSKRDTLGAVWLIIIGPVEKKVKFHVLDIKASYNLLLGRPWLHELKVIPSTLHQKY